MINSQGGINGRKITLLSMDDGYSPPKTVEQTRKLVEQDEILADIGSLGTPTNFCHSEIPERQEGAAHPHFDRRLEVERREELSLDDAVLSALRARSQDLRKVHPQGIPNAKIGVIYQNDDFGKDYLRGFKEGLGEKADLIVKELSYEVTDPTIDSQIVNLKSAGADVLMTITTPKFGAQAIRKVNDLGWKPTHFIVSVVELHRWRARASRAGGVHRPDHGAGHQGRRRSRLGFRSGRAGLSGVHEASGIRKEIRSMAATRSVICRRNSRPSS